MKAKSWDSDEEKKLTAADKSRITQTKNGIHGDLQDYIADVAY